MAFKPATKEKSKLRLALIGPAGSGKTYTALTLGSSMGSKIAVIDTERGSASKYSDLFKFDVCELESHSPKNYIASIKEAEKAGYDVVVIDSLSHAWMGKDGLLEFVDQEAARSQSSNTFAAWRKATPQHNNLVEAMLNSKCHVIATMRSKMEYVLEENDRGKKVPKKVGMAPVQREGVEFEFDVTCDLTVDHDLIVGKTRCHTVDGLVIRKPGKEFAEKLLTWLDAGTAPAPKQDASPKESAGSAKASAESQSASTAAESAKTAPADKVPTQAEVAEKKSATTAAEISAGTTATSSAPSKDSPIAPEQLSQLLQAGVANGWNRSDISKFVCHLTGLEPATIQSMTWGQWELCTKVISHPKNAAGKVTHTATGKPVAADKVWPQVKEPATV